MEINEELEDYIKSLWMDIIENKDTVLEKDIDNKYTQELYKDGLIYINEGVIYLTEAGERLGRKLIRRHRLSERLTADLFLASEDEMERISHKIEHYVSDDVEENICRFLGHPSICPHGTIIPPGKCCLSDEDFVLKPVSELDKGFKGEVAHIKTKDRKKLQKIMSMGLLPGSSIEIIQTFPSFVFQVGQSQLAVDKEIADEIFVKMVDEL